MKEQMRIPSFGTRAAIEPRSYNAEKRTVDVTFATTTPVVRYGYVGERWGAFEEELSFDAKHVRMERLLAGANVLDNHDRYSGLRSVLGVVEDARLENKKGVATLRFSEREEVAGVVKDIESGIIRNVSVGYRVYKYEEANPERKQGQLPRYRAIDWEPMEISMVSVPADHKSTVRNEEGEAFNVVEVARSLSTNSSSIKMEENKTPETVVRQDNPPATTTPAPVAPAVDEAKVRNEATVAERNRVAEIRRSVNAAKLPASFADQHIDAGTSIDDVRKAIIDEFAKNDPHTESRNSGPKVGADERDKLRKVMGHALLLRTTPAGHGLKPEDVSEAREFRGMNMLRMAEESLIRSGVNTKGLTAREIAQGALGMSDAVRLHSTSDFPILLGETFNRTLRAAYEYQQRTFMPFCRRTNIGDFRSISRAQLSGLVGDFDEVQEGGEYKHGTFEEAKESYKLVKYGKKVAITWESIINDDLDALSRIPSAFAAKAAQKQSDIVYGILLSNPKMADNVNLFNVATHKNSVSSGTALSINTLGEARKLIRNQKGIEGDFINLTPKFLMVGPDNEQLALQLTSSAYLPTDQTGINVWVNSFTPIVEPRITGHKWFVSADPSQVDTIEYAFLDGEQELFTEQRVGFDIDGLEIKARMVFAAKAIDHRGLFYNPGAAPAP
jgi:phage head maturation protease